MIKEMKHTLLYIAALGMACTSLLSSCDNDFEQPPFGVPESRWTPNTTIAEIKEAYWNDNGNYCKAVGLNADGDSIIVKGRVISADSTGNIYKKLVIQDETGALAISANMKEMYKKYHFGQEVYVNLTGIHVGKYANLFQVGAPEAYSQGLDGLQTTFLSETDFKLHVQPVGWQEQSKVDTLVISLADVCKIKDKADVIKNMSRLIRLDNVYWENAGQPYSTTGNTSNQNLCDKAGNTIVVRCSGYSNFYWNIMPGGLGSVVGILGQFNQTLQLELIGLSGVIGFDPNAKPYGKAEYTKAASIESGKAYGLLADNQKLATPVASNRTYGYFYVNDVTVADGKFAGPMSNAFTFTAVEKGYTIQQADGRYLYMDDQGKNNFNVSETLGTGDEYVWTVAFGADGLATITNVARGKWIQYSSNYTSYGAYNSAQDGGFLPALYLATE